MIEAYVFLDTIPPPTFTMPQTPPRRKSPERAVYEVDAIDVTESSPSRLRAYANETPQSQSSPRMRTQVDLVLPPRGAYSKPSTFFNKIITQTVALYLR